ncbi:hypothetical protein ACF0H5_007185 [Mactra antiquata]
MRFIYSVFILCWIVAVIQCLDFCPNDPEQVVQICQTNEIEGVDKIYVNSGGVPKFQIVENCTCTIQPMNSTSSLMYTAKLVSHDNLKSDMKFYVNRGELEEESSVGGKFVLTYSKLDETSVGGGCVEITAENALSAGGDDEFRIRCDAKTQNTATTTKPSTMAFNGPSDDGDNTVVIGAVVGSLVLISIIIVIVVILIVKKRRRSSEQKNSNQSGNENIEKEYDETYDEYGMQLNPSYESSDVNPNNLTRKSSLYDHQYAIVDDQRHSKEGRSNSANYAYAECRSPSSNPTTNKNVQNQNEDTYDHTTTTTSAGSKNKTQNIYNHLPPSFSQLQSDVDEYNTVGTVNTNKIQTISANDYNVLNLS